MIAPAARPRLSLRISVTEQCQLRCPYCMPAEGLPAASAEKVLTVAEILRFVRVLRGRFDVAKVRLTGGEPLVRRDVAALVAALAAEGISEIALTTNAELLADAAADLRQAGLRRVNVHIDSLDPEVYRAITRHGRLARALEGIAAAQRAGLVPIKLNTVVLGGVNDGEVVAMARFGLERGCEVRFLEVMPIGVAAARQREWFVPSAEVRERLRRAFDLEPMPVVPGVPSRDFRARDAEGRRGIVGFISPCSEPFCGDCRRLRLTSTGRLLGCLGRAEGPDVSAMLRSPGACDEAGLLAAIDRALRLKQEDHCFAGQRIMVTVGG